MSIDHSGGLVPEGYEESKPLPPFQPSSAFVSSSPSHSSSASSSESRGSTEHYSLDVDASQRLKGLIETNPEEEEIMAYENESMKVDRPFAHSQTVDELWRIWEKHRRWRYLVVFLCFLGIVICYADRSNISTAVVDMQEEFQWSNSTQGVVLSSFYIGYTIAQVPGGWASQKFGGKSVLLAAVALWSAFTIMTPPVSSILPVLIIVRIFLGLGEGVSFPAVHQLIARWIPPTEHSRAVAIVTAGSYMGTVAANFATPLIIGSLSWHWSFYIFGSTGLVWCLFWMPLVPFWPPPLPKEPPPKISKEDHEDAAEHLLLGMEVNSPEPSSLISQDEENNSESGIQPSEMVAMSQPMSVQDRDVYASTAEEKDAYLSVIVPDRDRSSINFRDVSSKADHDGVEVYGAGSSQDGFIQNQGESEGDETNLCIKNKARLTEALSCGGIPWASILAEPGVWAIVLNQFFNSWGFYVLLNWTPTYYKQELQVEIDDLSYLLALPYFVQGIVGMLVGVAADYFIVNLGWSVCNVRRIFQITGMVGPGVMLIVLCYGTKDGVEAMVYLMIALGLNSFTLAGVSVYHLDIAPKYAGVVFGIGNMAGNIPGIIAVWSTGVLLDQFDSWQLIFWIAIVQYFLGAIVWFFCATKSSPSSELALDDTEDSLDKSQ